MSIANPLTASSDIQLAPRRTISPESKPSPIKIDVGEFAGDLVEISQQGIEKQKRAAQLESKQAVEKISNDVVRVSSSIGKARSQGNLSTEQATALYNKIASLL
jgi:hypothetical protein